MAVRTALVLLAVLTSACTAAGGQGEQGRAAIEAAAVVTTTQPTTTLPPAPVPPTAPPTTVPPTTLPPPPPRVVSDQPVPTTPFAAVEAITLFHPSTRVERVGFHESNHDGARQLGALPTTVAGLTLEPRERGTGTQSAADVVVDPNVEIRAPVTGTVKRGGGYTLYCKYRDDFVVIAPDAMPAWEVKILHIDGLRVRAGQRVIAGETVLAPRPTQLPFASQIDEVTADPAWPHVHIEVVDPSIKDRPSPGGGCS